MMSIQKKNFLLEKATIFVEVNIVLFVWKSVKEMLDFWGLDLKYNTEFIKFWVGTVWLLKW